MEENVFTTTKYKNAELKTYTSISALSEATGLEKKILSLAKKRNFKGFTSNQRVNWNLLKPELEERYKELEEALPDDIATYKKEIAKREVKLKDLQIRKLEKNLIEPSEVKALLVELATKQSVVLKQVFSELPPKITGKPEPEVKLILDKALQDIFKVLQESDQLVDKVANE